MEPGNVFVEGVPQSSEWRSAKSVWPDVEAEKQTLVLTPKPDTHSLCTVRVNRKHNSRKVSTVHLMNLIVRDTC